MGKFKVKLSDSLTIVPVEVPQRNKSFIMDSAYTSNNAPLMVKIAATHSGLVTRNNGFYMPDKMRAGAITFIQNYGKPVLLHHNEMTDPVGRVRHASYVDTSSAIERRDSYLKDFVDQHVSFETKISLIDRIIEDGLLDDPSYDGVGYIELIAEISDQNAIEKVMDNRYLTVSIGAETNAAICSICKSDWAETGEMCDHVPGEEYDGKPAFIIAGDLFYDEVSFVSTPADPHAKVIQIAATDGNFRDSKSVAGEERKKGFVQSTSFDMYLSGKNRDYNFITDSVSDILKEKEKEEKQTMKKKLIEDASSVDIDSVVADSVTRIVAANENVAGIEDCAEFAIRSHLSTIEEEKLADVEIEVFDAAVVELITFIKKVSDSSDEDFAKIKEDEKESRLALVEDIADKFRVVSDDSDSGSDDGVISDITALDAKDVFEAIETIMDELELGDSKIAEDKRKSTPKVRYCLPADKNDYGIKGYFPVPNLDYVRATKKYLEDCKLSDDLKEQINAELDRKAKVFGQDAKVASKVADIAELSEEELKALSGKVFNAMKEKGLLEDCQGCDESASIIGDLEDRVSEVNDQLSAVRVELKEAFKDSEEVNILYADLLDKHKELKAQYISDLSALKGEEAKIEDLNKKSASEVSDLFNSIKDTVDISAIATRIKDGTDATPSGTVDDPTLQHDNGQKEFDVKVVKEVLDNAFKLIFSRGQEAANAYLKDCKVKGLVPQDLDSLKPKE